MSVRVKHCSVTLILSVLFRSLDFSIQDKLPQRSDKMVKGKKSYRKFSFPVLRLHSEKKTKLCEWIEVKGKSNKSQKSFLFTEEIFIAEGHQLLLLVVYLFTSAWQNFFFLLIWNFVFFFLPQIYSWNFNLKLQKSSSGNIFFLVVAWFPCVCVFSDVQTFVQHHDCSASPQPSWNHVTWTYCFCILTPVLCVPICPRWVC